MESVIGIQITLEEQFIGTFSPKIDSTKKYFREKRFKKTGRIMNRKAF